MSSSPTHIRLSLEVTWYWCSMLGDLIIPVDSLSISLGMGLSITGVKLPGWLWRAIAQWSEHLQLLKAGGPGFFSFPPGLLILMGWRICGALDLQIWRLLCWQTNRQINRRTEPIALPLAHACGITTPTQPFTPCACARGKHRVAPLDCW